MGPDTTRVSAERRARLMRLASYASISVALTLVAAKAGAWGLSGSVSLLASLADSALDVLASLLNLVAVHHSLAPADREHRFGHGKAEALAGLAQALFVAASAAFVLVESTRRLVDPQVPAALDAGVAVMVFSMLLTSALLLFQRHVVRVTGSVAISADALHFRVDLLVNASVILALLLAAAGMPVFDALFAVGIAVYILWSVRDIALRSIDHLMDRELPDADRKRIKAIVAEHPRVCGLHDLRSRRAGNSVFIQLHLELDDELSLLQAHQISDDVEAAVVAAYPGAEVIIHTDPLSVVAIETGAG